MIDYQLITVSIETATNVCSVALSSGGEVLLSYLKEGNDHAVALPFFLQDTLNFARKNELTVENVAVSSGPGSYTGLRIGVSSAKGLCYGLGATLTAVDTLQVLCVEAQKIVKYFPDDALLCPMLDARRMEVYTAFYHPQTLKRLTEIEAKIIDENAFQDIQRPIYFFGNGAAKCKKILTQVNAYFVDAILPKAENMNCLLEQSPVVDTAYFEPFYLKAFVAAPSHIKGLQ